MRAINCAFEIQFNFFHRHRKNFQTIATALLIALLASNPKGKKERRARNNQQIQLLDRNDNEEDGSSSNRMFTTIVPTKSTNLDNPISTLL